MGKHFIRPLYNIDITRFSEKTSSNKCVLRPFRYLGQVLVPLKPFKCLGYGIIIGEN